MFWLASGAFVKFLFDISAKFPYNSIKRKGRPNLSQEQLKEIDEKVQQSRKKTLAEDDKSANREIKDGVFATLLRNPENAAEVYSSLHNEPCRPEEIQIFTIETVISGRRKNDAAIVAKNRIIALFEHMSTAYLNLPFRFLIYLGLLYEKWLTFNKDEEKIYSSKLYKIPKPEFVVFYNGETTRPEQETLRLSDAFVETGETFGDLELEVKVYNINKGMNEELMNKCSVLREYSEFVAKLKEFKAIYTKDYDTAVQKTVEYCISNNILEDFLREHGGNIMSILNISEERYWEVQMEDAREEGMEEGIEKGIEKGMLKGKIDVALNLLKLNLSIAEIAKATELSPEEIAKLTEKYRR